MTFSLVLAYIAFTVTSILLASFIFDEIVNHNSPDKKLARELNLPRIDQFKLWVCLWGCFAVWVVSGIYIWG